MLGEVAVWVLLGGAVGLAGFFAIPGVRRVGVVGALVVAVAGALVGGFVADATVGDVGSVRVTVSFGDAFGSVRFGLVPFVASAAAALAALVVTERVAGSSARSRVDGTESRPL